MTALKNKKIIYVLIPLMIVICLFTGCSNKSKSSNDTNVKQSTPKDIEETQKAIDGLHFFPLLLGMKDDKAKIRSMDMLEERKIGSLVYKFPQGANIQMADTKSVLAADISGIKYRLSIFNIRKDYPNEAEEFTQKQMEEMMKEFMVVYKKERGNGNFTEVNFNTYVNDNKVNMFFTQSFNTDGENEKYARWYIYVTYHKGQCYCIEVNEGTGEFNAHPQYLKTYAFLNSLKLK